MKKAQDEAKDLYKERKKYEIVVTDELLESIKLEKEKKGSKKGGKQKKRQKRKNNSSNDAEII